MSTLDFSLDRLFDPITTNLNELLPKLPNALVTLLLGIVVIRVISWILGWMISYVRMPKGLKGIIVSLIDALLTVFLIIVVLQSLGLSNLAFVFSAAIAAVGLALGNGSVNLVQDILAGVYLARDRDFSIGDMVVAGDDRSVEGEVLSMDMRRTRILDKGGRIHSLPNSLIERQEYVLIAKKRDRKA